MKCPGIPREILNRADSRHTRNEAWKKPVRDKPTPNTLNYTLLRNGEVDDGAAASGLIFARPRASAPAPALT